MQIRYLNGLRALEASVRLGSFRAAAEELSVTPAAVGQHVRRLEQNLGRTFLRRGPNGFTPTDAALWATVHLAAGFDHCRDALATLSRSEPDNRVAISIVPTLAEHWLAPHLPEFLSGRSGIDFRIDSSHPQRLGPDSGYDFSISYEARGPRAASETELFREWLIPVCTPALAARLFSGEVPLIHVDSETDDETWLDWPAWSQRTGFPIDTANRGLRFKHATFALRACFAGHGLHLAQFSLAVPQLLERTLAAPYGPASAVQTGYPYRLSRFGPKVPGTIHADFSAWIRGKALRTQAQMQRFLAAAP